MAYSTVAGKGITIRETFAAATAGEAIPSSLLLRRFSLQVVGSPVAADSWMVVIEGSLDGTNFSPILTHATGDGSDISFSGALVFPSAYIRLRVAALNLGVATSLIVNGLATI